MILHVFHVYLVDFRKFTQVTGVVLATCNWLFLTSGPNGFNIVTGVPKAIPLIGSPLVELLRGSASVGQSTLTRFYSLHTFVLPLLTAVFKLMHFLMIRKQGIQGENIKQIDYIFLLGRTKLFHCYKSGFFKNHTFYLDTSLQPMSLLFFI